MKGRRLPRRCGVCGAQCTAYLCGGCGRELRELLVGSDPQRVVPNRDAPGLPWYAGRLIEQMYRQSRLGTPSGPRSSDDGYGLLADHRAGIMLAGICNVLGGWVAVVRPLVSKGPLSPLCGPLSDEWAVVGTSTPAEVLRAVVAQRARFLAEHVNRVRLRCPEAPRMHGELLGLTRDAWAIINRPADEFCGPCPAPSRTERGAVCGTMLYTLEHQGTVVCQRCRAVHDVDTLRAAMRDQVVDMLFTGPEIRRLMETRLADPISKAGFHRMVNDGRLIPRGYNADGDGLYTYADVRAARTVRPTGGRRK